MRGGEGHRPENGEGDLWGGGGRACMPPGQVQFFFLELSSPATRDGAATRRQRSRDGATRGSTTGRGVLSSRGVAVDHDCG